MLTRPLLACVLLLVPLAACGSKGSSGGGGAGTPPGALTPGTGSLTGPSAFPVKWVWMDSGEVTSSCGGAATSSGGVAAIAVELFEDDESSLACSDGGSLVSNGTGRDIDLEIATTEYIQGATTLTQTLGPGTYVIGDEGEDDPDLCMLPSGTNAFLEVLDFGTADDAVETAVSGTVTIDTLSATEITGTFDVYLGGPYGQTDGGPQSLTGSFDAVPCP
jgi:hypothetical protein